MLMYQLYVASYACIQPPGTGYRGRVWITKAIKKVSESKGG